MKSAYVPQQQIGKSVAAADVAIGCVEGEETLLGTKTTLLILLRDDGIGAELEVVFARDLGEVVAQGVSGVGIFPWDVGIVFLECAVGSIASHLNAGEFVAKIREDSGHGHARWPSHRPGTRVG